MFIGHFAVGLALKRSAPAVSLGVLFLCTQFLDLLWPTLLLLGVEQVELAPGQKGPPLRFTHYPYSHSLLFAAFWSIAIGAAYYAVRRNLKAAAICALAVISHWILDLIVHLPDLPLLPGAGPRVGFRLWESMPLSLALELLLYTAACCIYLRATKPADRVGSVALWSLLLFLLIIHTANIFGPPPPSVAAVAWTGQAQWLIILWAFWIDRHRAPKIQNPG